MLRAVPLCALFLIVFASSALALDPGRRISQYAHTAWRMQDGVFGGAPFAIAQTTDGYLWIGTQRGLLRFDGVRFVPWLADDEGRTLPENDALSLWGGRDGSLWIGTSVAISRLKDGRLTTYEGQRARVNAILEDPQGVVWYTRSRVADGMGSVCEITNTGPRCYAQAGGQTLQYAIAPTFDRDGTLWFWSSHGLVRWTRNDTRVFGVPALAPTAQLSGVGAIGAAADGAIWVGMTRRGPGLGLVRFEQNTWRPFAVPDLDGSTLQVQAMLRDRQNALWIGTTDRGLFRLRDGRVDHFGTAEGLSGETVRSVFEDREGNVWVVTSDGLDCFRDTRVMTLSLREGLTANWASSVLAARDGAVWIGNHDGLDVLRPNGVSSIRAADGLPGVRVTSMFEDRAGRLWIGVDDRLFVYEGGRFHPVTHRDGKPTGIVLYLAEDSEQNIWAVADGQAGQLARIRDRTVVETVPASVVPRVRSMAAAPDGGLWLGLVDGGLARYRNGKMTMEAPGDRPGAIRDLIVRGDGTVYGATGTGLMAWRNGALHMLTTKNGLSCDSIYGLVTGADNGLWLYAECGIIGIAPARLQAWHKAPESQVEVTTLDVLDGARPSYTPFRPSASRGPDGRLWFANDSVVQMVDPALLTSKGPPPVIHLEAIVADRQRYAPRDNLRIPALTRDLEINYTALSFVAPQKVRFRYKLEGRDRDWQNPGTRRQAFYTDLPPGAYRFRVIASNQDGAWNEQGATLAFFVAPAWYQTWSVRTLIVLSLIAAGWTLYRVRVRQIAREIGARFDERLAERTRIARELHDTLLQSVAGSKVMADEALNHKDDTVRMRGALEHVSMWLDQAVQEGRAALSSLRGSGVATGDLADAFRRAVDSEFKPANLRMAVSVAGNAREMHPLIRDEIYRIGYEAIHNACLHAKASRLDVELRYDHQLTLRVADNGIGMSHDVMEHGRSGHYGLQGMYERAARIGATLKLSSAEGAGTQLTLLVPGSVVFRKVRARSFI